MIKRALLSVSDKTGVVAFAKALSEMGIELISTGGTEKVLKTAGISVKNISEITNFPECLDGRVKTLHPAVHGGILAMRNDASHMKQLEALNIETIDMVVINLYPFKETILKENVTLEDAIENIDIGGPTMLRSAAKNHKDVIVAVDPSDYDSILQGLKTNGKLSGEDHFKLALKVFEHTAYYDAMIAEYLRGQLKTSELPEKLTLTYEKVQNLRYGENPQQRGAFYKEPIHTAGCLAEVVQLHGKELSFNNINDTNGALMLIKEFDKPTVVAAKHASPCGVGTGYDIFDAYEKAYACDPVSIFGGIVVSNRPIDARMAEKMSEIFLEIILAPDFEEDALAILTKKKNVRILKLPSLSEKPSPAQIDTKKILGGLIVQDIDRLLIEDKAKVVTERIPTKKEYEDLQFAWKVCKHAKSNGIVISKEGQTLGIGQGQVSRVWATDYAVKQSLSPVKGAVLASDAFFPFADAVEIAIKAGVSAIIQPGGSIRDQEVIDVANKHGIAMVFTEIRHFKH